MAFVGYNCRSTLAYVTDASTEVDVLGISDGYPQTDHIDDYGWESISSDGRRDRNSGIDARLAGINFQGNDGTQHIFAANTGNGVFDVTLALGDATSGQTIYAEIVDLNTSNEVQSVLFTVAVGTVVPTNDYIDATGVTRTSDTDWVSNNATKQVTVASGRLGIRIGSPTGASSSSVIAHFGYEAVGAVDVTGTIAVTQDDQTSNAVGLMGTNVTGTVAVTQADNVSTAEGTIGDAVTGTAAITQEDQTSDASGTIAEHVTGTAAIIAEIDICIASGFIGEFIPTVPTAGHTKILSTKIIGHRLISHGLLNIN